MSAEPEFKLVGFGNFKRHNPRSDRFDVGRYDHLEFWCNDATNVARRFAVALGMQLVARSDLSTGNELYSSYVMKSNDIYFVITSPMGARGRELGGAGLATWENFDQELAYDLIKKHGPFVRQVGITVADAKKAHDECVANGGTSVLTPRRLDHSEKGQVVVSEVSMYGDVVLRFVQRTGVEKPFEGVFLPGYIDEPHRAENNYGPSWLATRVLFTRPIFERPVSAPRLCCVAFAPTPHYRHRAHGPCRVQCCQARRRGPEDDEDDRLPRVR